MEKQKLYGEDLAMRLDENLTRLKYLERKMETEPYSESLQREISILRLKIESQRNRQSSFLNCKNEILRVTDFQILK